MHYTLLHGDNREQLKHIADNSIDSIVCDPPYELGFMGKRWDSTGIAYDLTVWTECLRVLKPGGHLIAFGGTRTYHRMTVAIEDAGFEIRDCIMWLYGSGFPKSHDVSKAIDKAFGIKRTVKKGIKLGHEGFANRKTKGHLTGTNSNKGWTRPWMEAENATDYHYEFEPATEESKQWHGWGTALKPAVEPAVLARKPLTGTVAGNITAWGVGGINVDGCRVGDASGRWPANVILDESAGEALDEQSGVSTSVTRNPTGKYILNPDTGWNNNSMTDTTTRGYSDIGGASRFFYTAKASKAEREAGLEGMDAKQISSKGNGLGRTCETCGANTLDGCECENRTYSNPSRLNHHPTVKPIALMRYLVRLVTPKGGTVLDPFMGSGSTGCAAMCEGINFVGIELNEEYVEIAKRRIEYWQSQNPMGL